MTDDGDAADGDAAEATPDGDPDDVHGRAATVRDHLEATETLPVDPAAGRWIGEAHAVAADAADPGAPVEVVRRRMREVVSLLEEVESAGNADADDRVAAARERARELAADVDADGADGDGGRDP